MQEHTDGDPAKTAPQPIPQPEAQPQQPPQPQPQPPQAQAQAQAQQPQSPPSAYPYPNPRSPGGYGHPAAPAPPQQNPYAQPAGIHPTGAYPFPPPPSGRAGAAWRAVLWAAVGAVAASALWAGGVLLLGGDDDPKADLRGYRAKANLCSSVDASSVEKEYPENSDPTHHFLEHKALDQSYCSISLEKSDNSYSYAYLTVQMDLHKETDPGPEFTALWSEYDQRYDDYDVDKVTGFGDEAYLVTSNTTSGSSGGSLVATLAVRDGWMTYQMSWSSYTYDDESEASLPELSEVEDWVRTDSKVTLENLGSD